MADACLPVLYSFRRCPYAMRARLALAASGQLCELREVELRAKPVALLAASPKGTVPVLVLPDGEVIEESLDIMLWALRRHDPVGWLQPLRGDMAEMLALVAECDGRFKHHLDRYKYPQRYAGADSLEHRAAATPWLRELDGRLRSGSYLFGSRAALADMAIAPFVRQFAQADAAWFDAQPWHGLNTWLRAWLESEWFARVMGRYLPWEPGSPLQYFPQSQGGAGAASGVFVG